MYRHKMSRIRNVPIAYRTGNELMPLIRMHFSSEFFFILFIVFFIFVPKIQTCVRCFRAFSVAADKCSLRFSCCLLFFFSLLASQ